MYTPTLSCEQLLIASVIAEVCTCTCIHSLVPSLSNPQIFIDENLGVGKAGYEAMYTYTLL